MLAELRFSIRTLAKSPAFTVATIGILALGIGASCAIFSVVHALLLAPLRYPDASALVQVQSKQKEQGFSGLAPATYADLASGNTVFASLAAQYYYYINVTGSGEPVLLTGAEVTPDYFNLFGVGALRGRTWNKEDTKAGATPVVVLSHAFWRRQFNARDSLIGEQIMLDQVAHTVIGVMPASFKDPGNLAQLWRPMRAEANNPLNRSWRYWTVYGRLRPGVALARANTELTVLADRLAQAHPRDYAGWTIQAADLRRLVIGDFAAGLLVVLGAVGCIVLITCANVAGLAVVRAAVRRKELAIRAALGASRGQLVRQLLLESLLLALAGGALGLLLGSWGLDALLASVPEGWLPRADEIALNLPVLAATLALTMLTGLASGVAPGFTASRTDGNDALKDNPHGTRGPATRRLRAGLVVAEIALACVLLAGASLLGRSFLGLLGRESGIDAARVLALSVSLAEKRYDNSTKLWDFYSRAQTEVAAVPGVQSAGFTQSSPFRWGRAMALLPVDGNDKVAAGDTPPAFYDSVSVDYFKSIGIPLLAGRYFTAADDSHAQPVAIISETMARRLFGAENPLGHKLTNGAGSSLRLEIVGVVRDVRRAGLAAEVPLQAYCPLAQYLPPFATLMVRTTLPPAALAKAVQQALWRVDPDTPVSEVAPMDRVVSATVARPRLYLTLFGIFASLALMLAATGLYGLIAYNVTQRTREFGIRAALGASPRDVLALVLREGAWLTGAGLGLGLGGAFAATRLLAEMIYATSPHDPLVFTVVPLALAIVAILACWLPARRATKVDPMVALRAE